MAAVRFIDNTSQVIRRIEIGSQRGLEEIGRHMVRQLQKTVGRQGTPFKRSRPGQPPRRQSGKLQGSFTSQRRGNTITIGSSDPKAVWLEKGTRAHIIRVKRARVLANRETGQVFGRWVRVEMRPRPFFAKAIRKERSNVQRLVGNFFKRFFGRG